MKSDKEILGMVFKFLRCEDYKIEIKRLKGGYIGMSYADESPVRIAISPFKVKGDDGSPQCPPATLIHEVLHILFPNWTEEEVIQKTESLWKILTPYQKLELYERIFEDDQETKK
jgi:hypothetical protein